jgi:hypothetical protein
MTAWQALLMLGNKSASSENQIIDMTGRAWAALSERMSMSHVFLFRNAIAVQNIGRTQVGHIPRQMAAMLAPHIDSGLITVEGTMNEGNCKSPRHMILYLW